MSTVAIGSPTQRTLLFYQSAVGKKVMMAVSGFILYGFIIGHMLGNLQVFIGPEALNGYAEKLRSLGELLWVVRGALLLAVVLHILSAAQLYFLNRQARPNGYAKKTSVAAGYASRTMYLSGPIIAAFVLFHLMDLTWGVKAVHPEFNYTPDVYRNVVTSFSNPAVSGFYILAMALLGLHLLHGVWSMFQTVGVNHPMYNPWLRRLAMISAAALFLGNISIPISVMAGLIR
jgi:succinate dehydrogenase / fumarate reductase, cytochrome b subunit